MYTQEVHKSREAGETPVLLTDTPCVVSISIVASTAKLELAEYEKYALLAGGADEQSYPYKVQVYLLEPQYCQLLDTIEIGA